MISRRSKAALARVLANMGHAHLDSLAFEFDVDSVVSGFSLEAKSLSLVKAIERRFEYDERSQDNAFIDLASRMLVEPRAVSVLDGGEVIALTRALELDGYEQAGTALQLKVPGAIAPHRPVSWLEGRLDEIGLVPATEHFRQAVQNYSSGNWESCNSQIRSFLEAVLLEAGSRTGKQFADPTSVLQHLQQIGRLAPEEAQHAKSVWNTLQSNGAHAGLSDHDEAQFRLHSVSALARYLITKGLLATT